MSTTLINPGDGMPSEYTLWADYAQNSRQGWTSSLSAPYVEYTGWNEPFVARFTQTGHDINFPDDGKSWDYLFQPQMVNGSQALMYSANRAILHMPDGSSHEMRQDDLVYLGSVGGSANRIYYATDGSRVKYDPTSQVVFLPDGSRYLLNTANGAQYIDRNGNSLNYNSSSGQWTDTLNRVISDPLGGGGSQYNWAIPNAQGGMSNYIFRWSSLGQVLSDLSQPLHYVGPITIINPTQYPFISSVSPALFSESYVGTGAPAEVLSPSYFGNPPDRFNPSVLSEIELPNGQKYRFTYNVYGEIDKVYLPTGGYRRYRYDYVPTSDYDNNSRAYSQANRGVVEAWESATGNSQGETPIPWKFEPMDENGAHYIKATDPDGSYVRRYLNYRDPFNNKFSASPGEAKAGRIYDERHYSATGTMLRRVLTNWVYTAAQGIPFNPQANNPVGMDYVERNARITRQVEILLDTGGNALATATEMDYDDYLNVKETRHYDYVSVAQATAQTGAINAIANGALLRKEEMTYLVMDTAATLLPGLTLSDYINRNLVSLPSKMIVKDGAGNVVAATEYVYDKYPLTTYSAVTNWAAPPNAARGNATTVRRWQDYNYATKQRQAWGGWTGGMWITVHSWYDQCGSVVKTSDAKSNETTISYADNFSGYPVQNTYAYSTSVTTPVPGGAYSSPTAFTTTSQYNFSTGLPVSTTDPTGVEVRYEYNDQFNRATKVRQCSNASCAAANGLVAEVRYKYGEPPMPNATDPVYVRTSTMRRITTNDPDGPNTAPDDWLQDYVVFDGLGRAIRSAHKDYDPPVTESGEVVTPTRYSLKDTVYDSQGRVIQVSNPYFDPSYIAPTALRVWTTTAYDALSRITRIISPDGSHVDTSYSGNQVTVADQLQKKRSSTTDALGRMVQVIEAPDVAGYQYRTDYGYDVLGNLIRVRQGGFSNGTSGSVIQTRSFFYDSLSRLAFASNPEQDATIQGPAGTRWTMKYEYDNNGNLLKRTDARGVMTDYLYDNLNRNTKLTYTSPTPSNLAISATATVERYYDTGANCNGGAPTSFAYGLGRLRLVKTVNAANPSNTSQSANSCTMINSYDAAGRALSQTQAFETGAVGSNAWTNYTMTRGDAGTPGYNAAGAVQRQYYPSGRQVNYFYDIGGRLRSFTGNLGDGGQIRNYTNYMVYNEVGQMLRESFSTDAPLVHSTAYNNRFQMIGTRVGTTSNPASDASWNRGKLNFYYSDAARGQNNPAAPGDNNGNVSAQEHIVPLSVDGNGNVTSSAIVMRDDYYYDPLNRLRKTRGWQLPAGGSWATIYKQSFTYDQFGNRKIDRRTMADEDQPGTPVEAQTFGTGINDKVYEPNKRNNRLNGLVYDAAGNVINDSYTFRLNDRKYDAENRMTQAAGTNGAANYYVYDGDGKRVRRIVNGTETWQVYWIDGGLLAEYAAGTAATSPQKEYGYRNGQLLITAEPASQVKWLVSDHLGTPRIIVDTGGSLINVWRHDYLPFGEELIDAMAGGGLLGGVRSGGNGYTIDAVRQKFTGYDRDGETGLDYAQARYYASSQGRFASPDPMLSSSDTASPQSWNRYSYASNNPLKYRDPLGLYIWDNSLGGSLTDDQLREIAGRFRGSDRQAYLDVINRRQAFRDALEAARDTASDQQLSQAQQLDVASSVGVYGAEGQDNGVSIASGRLADGVGAQATPLGYQYDKDRRVIGTLSRVTIDTNTTGNALAGAIAHEGSHVRDRNHAVAVWTISGRYETARDSELNVTQYETENRAYHVSSYVYRHLNQPSLTYTVGRQRYEIWRRGMADVDQQTLNNLIQAHYGVTSVNQGPRQLP